MFTAETAFTFPGGGFIVGFGQSSGDGGCDQVLTFTDGTDPSGLFYSRFLHHPDRDLGTLDEVYGAGNFTYIGGIKIYPSTTPILMEPNTRTSQHTAPVQVIVPQSSRDPNQPDDGSRPTQTTNRSVVPAQSNNKERKP